MASRKDIFFNNSENEENAGMAFEDTGADGAEEKTAIASLTKEQASKSVAIEIPEISLPRGGGALKGIDEKFEVNAANGTASFTIPLPVSEGRNGVSPSLSLSYNSGGGNSPFGLGWSLKLPDKKRKTDKLLPRYQDDQQEDTFMFSGGEDLVPYLKEDDSGDWSEKVESVDGFTITQYRPRVEGSFARIEKITNASNEVYWKITTRDNVTTFYGRTHSARISDPENPKHVFQWLPELKYDDKGNWIQFHYKKDSNINADGSLNKDDSIPNHQYEKNRKSGLAAFTNTYLKRITYGNLTPYFPVNPYAPEQPENSAYMFELVLDYGEHDESQPTPKEVKHWQYRQDAFSSYRSGFEIRTNRLCKRILMFHHFPDEKQFAGTSEEETFGSDYLVRSLNLTYEPAAIDEKVAKIHGQPAEVVYLKSITESGYIRKPDGSYSKKSLPSMEFNYEQLNWNQETRTVSRENIVNAPVGLTNNYQWVDLYGEGISGILTEQGQEWFYKSNQGDVEKKGKAAFTPARKVIPRPSFTGFSNGVLSVQDLAANGEKQVVVNSPGLNGYFELANNETWNSFQSFKKNVNLKTPDPNTRRIDLNGDGQPELVVTEENAFVWYPSDGKKGHKPAEYAVKPFDDEKGPAIVFADQNQSIFLADMTGDGLTDIVRIRNGEICYWANKGYGKFSAKVTMSNSPFFDHPDLYDPKFLHLADVSGTGATDIIYTGKNIFKAFLNLSGNAWSDEHIIEPFFPVDDHSKLSVADLLGTGTSCIIWSSDLPEHSHAPMRYIDLMDSKKPHVLIHYSNNTGKETHLEYKSSTWFYLKDKLAGKPWITKLPFPVQVVNKQTVEEKISKVRFSTQYSYHHGYYDHPEREFRGFGMVEKIDSEHYTEWKSNNANNKLEKDEKLYQKPVLTKTWYHTGAFLDRERILSHFKNEYWFKEYNQKFPNSPVAISEPELPDARIAAAATISNPDIIKKLSGEAWREALRACKGMALRQEVFALDGEEGDPDSLKRQAKPYSVATHTIQVQLLQPEAGNRHAVFMVTQNESLDIRYERNEEDPRFSHALNVKTDELGNILESASVVYPRKTDLINSSIGSVRTEVNNYSYERNNEKQPCLDALDFLEKEQRKTVINYTRNKFTKDIKKQDVYRLRAEAETQEYEITGLSPSGSLFKLEDFANILNDPSGVLKYHESPDPASAIPQYRLIEHVQHTYYDDDLKKELPLGQQGKHGIDYQSYQLAYTPALLQEIFGNKLPSDQTELENLLSDNDDNSDGNNTYSQCRFVHRSDENWWIRSGIRLFNLNEEESLTDIQNRFFTAQAYQDPFAAKTAVSYYQNYFMMIDSSTDAFGNTEKVERFNFRNLSPSKMRDMNDNISQVLIDELKMTKAMALFGKSNEADNLDGLTEYSTESEEEDVKAYFTFSNTNDLRSSARKLLKNASTRFVYDFHRYENSKDLLLEQESDNPEAGLCEKVKLLPVVVGSIVREQHVEQIQSLSEINESPLQLAFEYSDGMGNVAMAKRQAEPGEALKLNIEADCTYTVEQTDTGSDLRWIANGRTVLNNKGNPVKQYEPYFSVNPFYEDAKELVERGVTPVLYYDSLDRQIRTEFPDGTHTRTAFNGWQQWVYDQNDTILEAADPSASGNEWYEERVSGGMGIPAKEAAEKAKIHRNTPVRLFLDTLGRPVLKIQHNRWEEKPTGEAPVIHEELYATRIELDIEGNPRAVKDARENTVMSWKYDMLGHRVYQECMDGGQRWMLNNVGGNPLKDWDARGHIRRYAYDILQRPLTTHISGGDGSTPLDHTILRIVYGEGQPDDKQKNLRGQEYQIYDSGGLLQHQAFDFKGNLLEARRQLAFDYEADAIDWPENPAASKLESEVFTQTMQYDALNRVVHQKNWNSTQTGESIYLPGYNQRGEVKSKSIILNGTTTELIKEVRYNEKGQKTYIHNGNDTVTRYHYDSLTFRLIQFRTTRPGHNPAFPDHHSGLADDTVLQQLNYTYDAKGNITEIYDEAYEPVFFRNQHIEPRSRYTYDALYRLINTSGRENYSASGAPAQKEPSASKVNFPVQQQDPNGLRNYTQRYSYDATGNILKIKSTADRGSWTRNYEYDSNSNRLQKTWEGSDSSDAVNYSYNAHGSMLNLNKSPDEYSLQWDYQEMLHQVNLGGGGKAWYQYDSDKQRRRKRIDKNGGLSEDRFYLDGVEIYRRRQGEQLVEEIETHHVYLDDQRVLIVEDVKTTDDNNLQTGTLFRYQYGNHLGSVGLELNSDADIISYEEYHPYGTSAYKARSQAIKAAAKRYRYTGMERDEESGLSYHGARYYLPWLARWSSTDPVGIKEGLNLYEYVDNNPILLVDPSGNNGEETKVVKPYVKETLKEYGIPFAEEVEFEMTTKEGEKITGRFDLVIVDPTKSENKYVPIELKGKDKSNFSSPEQRKYVNRFESPEGSSVKITGKKGKKIGLEQGSKIKVNENSFLRLFQGNKQVFDEAVAEATGGQKIKHRFYSDKEGWKFFKKTDEFHKFLKSKGVKAASALAGSGLVMLKPLAAYAGPAGDVAEIGLAAKKVAEAPAHKRAEVAKEEAGGLTGGILGSLAAGAGVALVCSSGVGCVILGVAAVGAGGLAGDQAGRYIINTIPESKPDKDEEEEEKNEVIDLELSGAL